MKTGFRVGSRRARSASANASLTSASQYGSTKRPAVVAGMNVARGSVQREGIRGVVVSLVARSEIQACDGSQGCEEVCIRLPGHVGLDLA